MSTRQDINNTYTTKGIVLSDNKYRESSKIVNIFTLDLGKINVFVYGALKSKSGLLLSTKEMTKSNFKIRMSKNNYYIESAKIIDSNLSLAKDIKKYLTAQFICEIVNRSTIENYKDENIYYLIDTSFNRLKEGVKHRYIKVGFLIKYLTFIGFKPNLVQCNICNKKNDLVFSNKYGGLVCKSHLKFNDNYTKVDSKTIMEMNKLLYTRFSEYKNFDNIDKIDKILTDFFKYNTEISEIRSENIYNQLINL